MTPLDRARVPSLVVALTLALGCRPPPVNHAALATADAELLQGCYDCLLAARTGYRRLAATDRARGAVRIFEADLLIALREKELGLPPSDALDEARRIAPELPPTVEAARYLVLVDAVPPEPLGGSSAASFRFLGQHASLRARLDAELAWLARGQLRPAVRDYLRLALECAYPRDDQPLVPAQSSPLVTYRVASCGLGAIAELAGVRAREPRFVETAYFIANVEITLAARQGPGQARAHLAEAFARFPTSPAIAYAIGVYGLVVEDHREALVYFDRALALRANHDRALIGRTIALAGLGRHQEAIETATRAIVRDDGSRGEAYYWRASSHHALGQLVEARADITAAKDTNVALNVLTLAGIIAFEQGDLDPAQADLEAAIAMGHDCTARWYLGLVHRQRKTWLPAGQAFQDAIACYRDRARSTGDTMQALRARDGVDPAYRARATAAYEASIAADTRQWHLAALTGASCAAAGGDLAMATSLVDLASEDPALAERAAKLRDWLARRRP